MAMDELTAAASKWRQEADELLRTSKLSDILSSKGEINLTGSYKYDLMLGSDIDIYVLVPDVQARSTALDALNLLIEQNYWNGYLFYDFANHPSIHHPDFPQSYYVGLKTDFGGHRWKVDMWFGESSTLNHNNSWIEPSLTEKNKLTILMLKNARNNGQIQADSHTIYSAVLQHHVNTVDQFIEWITDRHATLRAR